MRIVFLGSGDFSVPTLRALSNAEDVDLVAVVCQPDRPAGRGHAPKPPPTKVEALELGIPILQPEKVSDEASVAAIRALQPDVFVVAAYGQILRQRLLDIPTRGSLNVHASLLPRHRGASPITASILAGDDRTGVTIMELVRALDAGAMVSSNSIPIGPDDTTGSLEPRLAELGAALLSKTLGDWYEGRAVVVPQDEALVTYARQIRREDARIDWTQPADAIWRRVRAYQPWPVAFTTWRGEELRILEAWPLPDAGPSSEPGTVVAVEASPDTRVPAGAFAVQTGAGSLAVLRLQRPGKRADPAIDFLRGQRDFVGQRLGS